MEPGVKEYLKRILNTISLSLLWMVINSTAGIMYDLAFIHDKVRPGNVLFFTWFVLSLGALLWYLIKLWSKPIDYER